MCKAYEISLSFGGSASIAIIVIAEFFEDSSVLLGVSFCWDPETTTLSCVTGTVILLSLDLELVKLSFTLAGVVEETLTLTPTFGELGDGSNDKSTFCRQSVLSVVCHFKKKALKHTQESVEERSASGVGRCVNVKQGRDDIIATVITRNSFSTLGRDELAF